MHDAIEMKTLAMRERMYLPTLAELLDRLCIVQLKEVFIPEHAEEYRAERLAIEHDVDLILEDKALDGVTLRAADLRALAVLMLTNRFIWENESKARAGGSEQDHLLKLTHSINGVRNAAKNFIAVSVGDRKDYKIDCFAAELIGKFGNWRVFE